MVSSQIVETLTNIIDTHLNEFLFKDARFYAERLCNIYQSEESLHMLAKCYYLEKKTKQTYLILQGSRSNANRYLLALTCYDLNKYEEASRVLLPSNLLNIPSKENVKDIPGEAAGLLLLGKIARKQNRRDSAIEIFKLCLQISPFMWGPIQELSELGEEVSSTLPLDIDLALTILNSKVPMNETLGKDAPIVRLNPKSNSHTNMAIQRKIFAERMASEGVRVGSGSPHVAASLGLSSSSFHIPFASPGSMPLLNTRTFQSDNNSYESSHISNIPLSDYRDSTLVGPSSVDQLNLTGNDRKISVRDKLPPTKLFNMSSPSMTPIQSKGIVEASVKPKDGFKYGSILSSTDHTRDAARNYQYMDNIDDSRSNDLGSYTPPMSARDETLILPQTTAIRNTLSPASRGRRVNFGPSARLSFSSIGVHNDITLEDPSEMDEHPSKILRTADGIDLSNMDINHTMISNESPRAIDDSTIKNDTEWISESYRYALNYVHAIITVFASSISYLYRFHCQDCIDLLHRLPSSLFSSAYTHQLIGKAYFESNDYKLSVLAYREMMRLEPFRTQGLEYLSSALWHLRKEKELCALAQQVVELDKLCPEVWCVIGNCFSLQREPDNAMRFFLRAVQLDGAFPYAHTLLGHEYVNNEDFERAIQSFRFAILHDDRHYNAWYGLGAIYYRQERYELAEYHFRRAIAINTSSSVLSCYLAMVLHAQSKQEKTSEALEILTAAIDRDPKNPQLHFQKAHVLMSIDEVDDAIERLESARKLAPKEPPIYSMLGRAYQRLGDNDEAFKYFNYAIDLDPKEATNLKGELDAIGEPSLDGILDNFL